MASPEGVGSARGEWEQSPDVFPRKQSADTYFANETNLELYGSEYRSLFKQIMDKNRTIAQLEADLERGKQHKIEGRKPELRDLAAKLQQHTEDELYAQNFEKKKLEEKLTELATHIKSAGGNPSDYTIQ